MKVAKIPEKYVLMAEPDHIFLRPIPNFMKGDRPAAFNFGYMNPASQVRDPLGADLLLVGNDGLFYVLSRNAGAWSCVC